LARTEDTNPTPDGKPAGEVTRLLRRMDSGDEHAAEELLPLVHSELHAIARRMMHDQRSGHTLQATALLNEAYLRLVGEGVSEFADKRHFLKVSAAAMRTVLVDHARRRNARKRGGDQQREAFEGLDEVVAIYEERSCDLLALDEALSRLGQIDEELSRIVELRFFAGLENSEVAEVMSCSTRKIERGWATARAWLGNALGEDET